MAMQSDRMQNERYQDWVKSSLSLHYVKTAVTGFAQDSSLTLHNQLRQAVQKRLSAQSGGPPQLCCTTCTSKSIQRVPLGRGKGVQWRINCVTCSAWLEEILLQHVRGRTYPHVVWENTCPARWASDPWEVAKVYQPRGCTDHTCAEDGDVAALLGFIIECKVPSQYFTNPQNLAEVRLIRNTVMHSSSLEVDHADMRAWTNTMIALLEDPKHFLAIPACQQAVQNIKQLQSNRLDVILNTQLEATALNQRKEVTKQDLYDIEKLIREVESKMDIQIQDLKEDVKTVKDDMKKVMNDNKRVEDDVHTIDARHAITESRLDKLDEQVQENEEILQRCVKNIQDIADNSNTANAVHGSLETALEKVDKCQNEIETEKKRIEEHQRILQEQSDALEAFRSQTHDHAERIKDLGQKMWNLNTSESRRDSHDSTNERPRKLKRQHIECLQRTLLDIYKKHCQRIPICPLFVEDTEHVDNIYVEPEIKIVPQVGCKTSTVAESDHTKSMYQDIFFNGDTECKNIYIVGNAGVGKSAFCEKMVSVWCRVHSGEYDSTDMSEDDKIMATFPLLFYITLKDASTDGSIQEMIHNQLTKYENIELVLETTKCLVILDGLDEWECKVVKPHRFNNKGIPNRPLSCSSVVLTTTRPWKLESLRLQMNEIDKQAHITGLGEKSSKKLAQTVIKTLCKDKKRTEEYDDFENALADANLKHFIHIPFLLVQLLCLWCDNKPFGNSQCDIYSNIVDRQLKTTEQVKGIKYSMDLCGIGMTQKLPKCFRVNKTCQKYKRTLFALSKFGFSTLFSKEGPSANIVDHLQINIGVLSEEDIDLCLKAGLLTQTQAESTCTERRKSINFIHKTYQEFFAAVYIVTLSSTFDLNQVFKSCCSVDKLLEVSDVFMFVYGMDSQVGNLLLQRILKVVSDDDKLLNNRRCCEEQMIESTVIMKLQRLTMNVLEEIGRNGQKNTLLQLEDLKVDHRNLAQTDKHLHNLRTKSVRSLIMTATRSSENQKVEYARIFETMCKSKKLEKLHLADNKHFIEPEKIYTIIAQSRHTIKSLRFDYVNLSKVSDTVLSIQKIVFLESLSLRYVYLTHKQIENILTFNVKGLNKCVQSIEVCGLRCVTHGPWKECRHAINMSNLKVKSLRLAELDMDSFQIDTGELEKIQFNDLPIPGSVCAILRCLQTAERLQEFHCSWCKDKVDVEQMISTLPGLFQLKVLEISRAEIKDMPLRLSPKMRQLERIELRDLSISFTELTHFLDSLPHTEHRLDVRLDGLTIGSENSKENFLRFIRESQRFVLLTSGDCINFHTVV